MLADIEGSVNLAGIKDPVIDELRQKVEESERAVESYRRENELYATKSDTVIGQQLAALNQELTRTENAKAEAAARLTQAEGTSGNDASRYELHATVSPCANFAEGTADFAEGTVNHDVGTLPTENNNLEINKVTRKREAACAARALTPDNFQEHAKAANGGRLTEQQLEAFCDYWTERNARGHCRFESEKFFELPKRIATWARRDRVAPAPAAAAKPERPVWKDCALRCRHWDSEKRWCSKFVRTEPKSCEQCKEF